MKIIKRRRRIIISVVVIVVVFGILSYSVNTGCWNKWNDSQYDLKNVAVLDNSPLAGKTMIFLGSSVTYGSYSNGVSFVQYLEKRDSIKVIEEAVPGTTLVTSNKNSYVDRMETNLNKNKHVDCFICQLSTNDATLNKPLGEISNSTDLNSFDTTTITGAIEYIIAYAEQTWKCPVVFYTDTFFGNSYYKAMVNRLLEIKEKWHIGVIDLLDDKDINSADKKDLSIYMANSIHPTKAGYLEWWTPVIEKYLYDYLK